MSATSSIEQYDAVIVGGGAAGLSAALTLGRSRRRVLLATSGAPRNAPAHAAHNVFTRDGTPPLDLLRIGREQLAPYDVTVRDACATGASLDDDRISVMLHGKLVGTVNKNDVTTDEVLAMIIMGKLPSEVTRQELAELHG